MLPRIRRAGLALIAGAVLVAAAPSANAGQVRFRVTVEEVVVEVVVTRGDRPVPGLTAEDFVLLDEGVPRTVRLLPVEELPVSVLFVMDLSESVSRERRQRLAAAARRFARELGSDDRCAVVLFASEPVLVHDFTACAEQPENPFPAGGAAGGTALWDSLLLASALLEEEPGRTALVIFTDGEDTMSWTPEGFVESTLQGSDAVVYGVIPRDAYGTARTPYRYAVQDNLPPSVARRQRIGIRRMNGGFAPDELAALLEGPRRRQRPRTGLRAFSELELLRHVAETTGGRVVHSRDEERLGAAYEEILEEMRSRYLLAFLPDPAAPPGWRRLEVQVAPDGADVRARRGYLHRPMDPEPDGGSR